MNRWDPYRLATLLVAIVGALVVALAITPAQAHHRPGHGGGGPGSVSATITFDVMGDLKGLETAVIAISSGTKSLGTNSGNDLALNMSFFENEVVLVGGTVCFQDTLYDGFFQIIEEESDGTATGSFFFTARSNDGATFLNYNLKMIGGIFTGDWPPNDGDTTMVDFDSWQMRVEGKGKKIACTGSGTFLPGRVVSVDVSRVDN